MARATQRIKAQKKMEGDKSGMKGDEAVKEQRSSSVQDISPSAMAQGSKKRPLPTTSDTPAPKEIVQIHPNAVVDFTGQVEGVNRHFFVAAQNIQQKLPSFVPFVGIIDFILHMNKHADGVVNPYKEDDQLHAVQLPPFSITPLYFVKFASHSQIFQNLCDCTVLKSVK